MSVTMYAYKPDIDYTHNTPDLHTINNSQNQKTIMEFQDGDRSPTMLNGQTKDKISTDGRSGKTSTINLK